MPRYVLLGDGESPHLLKWARALASHVELHAASTRGFVPEFNAIVPEARRLPLNTRPDAEGGNVAVLRALPRLAQWLRGIDPDWIHAHYLTSHGTLAWLARVGWRLRARQASSAWGSDILIAPQRNRLLRWVTRRVLRTSALCTSDSAHMAERMRELGARDVMTFPFGLESLPAMPATKQERLFFANRALEPLYRPQRVLQLFGLVAQTWSDAELVIANDGSLRGTLEREAAAAAWGSRVRFVGRLNAADQALWYDRACWYLSLPQSDSVSVSVLEAMAHACVPVLSDLPANRELIQHRHNGVIVGDELNAVMADLLSMVPRMADAAAANRTWIAEHAIFPQAVQQFVARLRELESAA